MSDNYAFTYTPASVYGHVIELVERHAPRSGVHLDLGCGFGAIAEPVRDLGLTYIGLDTDTSGLDDLKRRGFSGHTIDLQNVEETRAILLEVIGSQTLASISMLDTLEHLQQGPAVLAMLHELAMSFGEAPLVLSIPNVTHVDIGVKLLTAHWDTTATGLLDRTHVNFYSERDLGTALQSVGWNQVDAYDYRLTISDQHFPSDSIVLNSQTTLGRLLQNVREGAGDDFNVNQFVRAYRPTTTLEPSAPPTADNVAPPFLSIVIRSQGRRLEMLRDVLLCLVGQTSDDFEVVLVLHKVAVDLEAEVQEIVDEQPEWLRERIRVLREPEGGRAHPLNTGFLAAHGRYVCALDDDDLVFAHWVQTFVQLGYESPGRVLRTVAVDQEFSIDRIGTGANAVTVPARAGNFRTLFPERFDLFDHTVQNRTPLMVLAFPRQTFEELGLRIDESLPVCEDWDFLLRAAMLCGVADAPVVTAIYRKWAAGDASIHVHSEQEWLDAATAIVAKLDRQPILLAPGHFGHLRNVMTLAGNAENTQLALNAANRRITELEGSRSWRVTRGLRLAGAAYARGRRIIRSKLTLSR